MNIKEEIEKVQKLGKEIGFGWMMSLASALWRIELKSKGGPESGAHIVTGSYNADETDKKSMERVDAIVRDHLNE